MKSDQRYRGLQLAVLALGTIAVQATATPSSYVEMNLGMRKNEGIKQSLFNEE
jgi:hypothetical protein